MINTAHSLALVAVIALVTAVIRFLPFVLFSKSPSGGVVYLGKVLPFAIMGMLIIYCLKDVSLIKAPYGLPEAISILIVGLLHKWKHNTLISIISGTLSYMFLVQLVFI